MNGEFESYCEVVFGCTVQELIEALKHSPGSRGAVLGAISENKLKAHVENCDFEVKRIIEKPSGGNDAKNIEARGDFYVREKNSRSDDWIVLESKGLKSNSEFRGDKLCSREQVFDFLSARAFPKPDKKESTYKKGRQKYLQAKEAWKAKNAGKRFPKFNWSTDHPGPETFNLDGVWKSVADLKAYLDQLKDCAFTEAAYREGKGAVAILETHKPSKRVAERTGIEQASPLVTDFGILAVDLFFRTGRHEFAFANPLFLSHSPSSPEHLYQNYTIDILVPGLKPTPRLMHPWYSDFKLCVKQTKPLRSAIDESQIDHRFKEPE